MAHIGGRRLIVAAGLAVLALVACSPDRVEVQPTSRAAAATAGSCDPAGMTAVWAAFAQDFNNGSIDVDTYFAPDFQLWVDTADANDGGATRAQLAKHLADLQRQGVRLPSGIEFALQDANAGTYLYSDSTFQALAQLNCVTGRIRSMEINNWPG
jgi:hypothetical protein